MCAKLLLPTFDERIKTMKRERKIHEILRINALIVRKARKLLRDWCLKYTPFQNRRGAEALICDMLIAATALVRGTPVVTFNTRHFEWIAELKVLKPDYGVGEAEGRS